MKIVGNFTKMRKYLEDRARIVVSGHRGAAALHPENTLLSFEHAIEMGVDSLELDLNMTADGEIVVIHDTTVDRTTDGVGAVRGFTLEQIKAFDASCKFRGTYGGDALRIPSLIEFCELMSRYPHVYLNVEIKDYAHETVDKAVAILSEYGIIDRCVFTCFESGVIHYMYDEYGLLVQGFHESQLKNFVGGANGTYSKMYAVGIPMRLLSAEMCEYFEGQGILAWSYCPDCDEDVMTSLKCGARLVTSNNPEPALRLYGELGYR